MNSKELIIGSQEQEVGFGDSIGCEEIDCDLFDERPDI